MKPSIKFFRSLGLILFFAGTLFGMALFGGLTWANLEADFYFGFGIQGETSLKMACPLIMAPAETGQVTITISNPSDRPVDPLIQVDTSGPIIGRSLREHLSIEPGSTQTASWEVGSGDLAFGHLILAKVYQFQALSLQSADDTCGILVINVPGLTGKEIYLLALTASLLAGVLGFVVWLASHRAAGERVPSDMGGMLLLAGIVAAGIVVGSLGWWVAGLLAMAASLLLTAILLSRRANARR
jgi:hypothetical protein